MTTHRKSTKTDPHASRFGIAASVLVALIGVLGLVATFTTNGATGAAYQIKDTRYYVSFAEQYCPDPARPVPVFSQENNRVGEINSAFQGCIAKDESVPQSGSRFRPERNRNPTMFSDHLTRRGEPRRIKGMIWADY